MKVRAYDYAVVFPPYRGSTTFTGPRFWIEGFAGLKDGPHKNGFSIVYAYWLHG